MENGKKFNNFVIDLKLKGYSKDTIKAYLYHNKRFLKIIQKEPTKIKSQDIKTYLNYLVDKKYEPRTINSAYNSLKAYYQCFMNRKLFNNIKRLKEPKDLPQILTRDEIIKLIDNIKNPKHRLMVELLYSSGIRVGECVKVKIADIDFNEKIVFIKKGKGKKDRYTITSKRFIKDLKEHFSQKNADSIYLFENRNKGHLTIRTVQEVIKKAAKKAGIKKRVYPHLLRADFVTHLLEGGAPIEKVQKLCGHARIDTTLRYARLKTNDFKEIESPLDKIMKKEKVN